MLTNIEKVLHLQDLDFFRLASTEHLSELALLCNDVSFKKDETLIREGEPCSTLYLLLEGRISVHRAKEDDVVEIESKCVLDYWAFFSQGRHQFSARSLTPGTLLTVSFEEMADLLSSEPELSWAILRQLANLGSNSLKDAEIP